MYLQQQGNKFFNTNQLSSNDIEIIKNRGFLVVLVKFTEKSSAYSTYELNLMENQQQTNIILTKTETELDANENSNLEIKEFKLADALQWEKDNVGILFFNWSIEQDTSSITNQTIDFYNKSIVWQ